MALSMPGETLNRLFALVIAQLLPGLIVIFGLSLHVSALRDWLGTAAQQDVTLGGTVLVILAAIAVSMLLNGVRFIVFECVWPIARPRPDPDADQVGARRVPAIESAYQDLVAQHYAYYQFYGATCVAVPVFVVLWAAASPTLGTVAVAVAVAPVLEYILYRCTVDCLQRFLRKRALLLTVVAP